MIGVQLTSGFQDDEVTGASTVRTIPLGRVLSELTALPGSNGISKTGTKRTSIIKPSFTHCFDRDDL